MDNIQILGFRATINSVGETLDLISSIKNDDEITAKQRSASLSHLDNRIVSEQEFTDLQDILEAFDFKYLFYQELEQDTSWLPDFEKKQPFSNELAKPIWHWKYDFN